jgi:hypothetical protein
MRAMTPRHKILITSGSKKGTQIYYFFPLKGPRTSNPSQAHQRGLYREKYLPIGHLHVSREPSKIPLIRRPEEKTPIHVPQEWGPYGNGRPFPRLAYHIFEYTSEEPSFNHLSESPGIRASPSNTRFPSKTIGPLWREMPTS